MKKNNPDRFKHTCPVCKENYVGRRNMIYDTDECKAKANNDKAYEFRQIAKDFDNQLHNTYKILKQFYPKSLGQHPIDVLLLLQLGFYHNVFTGRLKDEKTGIIRYKVYNLAYELTNYNKQIIIYQNGK